MSSQRSEKLCVILGAGASYDVATEGNLRTIGASHPPLANELFNIQQSQSYGDNNYNNYLRHYPSAAFLASHLGVVLANRKMGMEEALTNLANSPNSTFRKHFVQIPMYLWHLIGAVTSHYVSRPGAYDSLLTSLFMKGEFEVLFIVMNYDLLFEKALEAYFGPSIITDIDDYMNESFKLLKPHGSVNWWLILPGERDQYAQHHSILTWDIIRNSIGGDIVFREMSINENSSCWQIHLEQKDKLWSKYLKQHALYPLITAPLANKTINDFVCPLMQREAAQEYLSDCDHFLIVGSSGLDTDLLEFLGGAINHRPQKVHIVGRDEVADVTKRYIEGINLFYELHLTNPKNIISSDRGFRSYLQEGLIDNLLDR